MGRRRQKSPLDPLLPRSSRGGSQALQAAALQRARARGPCARRRVRCAAQKNHVAHLLRVDSGRLVEIIARAVARRDGRGDGVEVQRRVARRQLVVLEPCGRGWLVDRGDAHFEVAFDTSSLRGTLGLVKGRVVSEVRAVALLRRKRGVRGEGLARCVRWRSCRANEGRVRGEG
jgi:hypothetical protein